jgi:hypothetical protein
LLSRNIINLRTSFCTFDVNGLHTLSSQPNPGFHFRVTACYNHHTMEKLSAFKQLSDTLQRFDNGGQFYDFTSRPEDGIITSGEIGKLAGVFSNQQKKVLYLGLSINALEQPERDKVISALSDEMKAAYQKYLPQELLPSEANTKGVLSANAIVTGVPKMIDSKKELNGFVMVPISAGKAISFMLIPIIEKYDVYELRDDQSSTAFLIAHTKGEIRLPQQKIKVAGILKELTINKDKKEIPTLFLESLYYADL